MAEIKWTAPEFEHHDKGFLWEAGIVFIAAILVILSLVWQRNFLFAVFIVIAAGTILFWGRKQPQDLEFVLDNQGLAIGEQTRYGYDEFSEFAMSPYEVTENGMVELVFHKKTAASIGIKMFAPKEEADKIREQLSEFLPEFEYRESMLDYFSRIFKF